VLTDRGSGHAGPIHSACVLIEAHDEWQDSDRRYLSEESMSLLNPPAPTALQTTKTPPSSTPAKQIAATA
jgi:putative transposase